MAGAKSWIDGLAPLRLDKDDRISGDNVSGPLRPPGGPIRPPGGSVNISSINKRDSRFSNRGQNQGNGGNVGNTSPIHRAGEQVIGDSSYSSYSQAAKQVPVPGVLDLASRLGNEERRKDHWKRGLVQQVGMATATLQDIF